MDFKIKINQAIDELEKITGKSATDPLRKAVAGESDQSKLFLKYQALRETLNDLLKEKLDVSFSVEMPDKSKKSFSCLADFFKDQEMRKELRANLNKND